MVNAPSCFYSRRPGESFTNEFLANLTQLCEGAARSRSAIQRPSDTRFDSLQGFSDRENHLGQESRPEDRPLEPP